MLRFYFDVQKTRSALTAFVEQNLEAAILLTRDGRNPQKGPLPQRVGEQFYGEPWVLYSGKSNADVVVDHLPIFSADQSKTPQEVARALTCLAASTDWAIFPWGGYARYGMLGLVMDAAGPTQIAVPPFFQYAATGDFDHAYRGVIARRTRNRSEFAPSLWRGVNGQAGGPSIITFEYYEGAFDGEGPAYSLVGTFQEDDGTSVSVYRVQNYSSFEYFVNLANQVSVFDVLPGTLKADSCEQVCRAFASLDVASVVQHTPWFLAYNGGEVDTDNVLFVSSRHASASHFVGERGNSMDGFHISDFV